MSKREYSEEEQWVICRSAVSENYKILHSIFGKDIYSQPSVFSSKVKRDFLAEAQSAIAKRFFSYDDEASEMCKNLIVKKKNWQDYLSKENLVSLFLLQNRAIAIALQNIKLPQLIEDKIYALNDRDFLATPIDDLKKIKGKSKAKKQVMGELQTVDTYKTVMMPIINKISKWYKREINFDPFANLEKRFGRLTQEDYLKLIKQEELGVDLNGNLISRGLDGTLYVNGDPKPDDYVIDFGLDIKGEYEDEDLDSTDYSQQTLIDNHNRLQGTIISGGKTAEKYFTKKESSRVEEKSSEDISEATGSSDIDPNGEPVQLLLDL